MTPCSRMLPAVMPLATLQVVMMRHESIVVPALAAVRLQRPPQARCTGPIRVDLFLSHVQREAPLPYLLQALERACSCRPNRGRTASWQHKSPNGKGSFAFKFPVVILWPGNPVGLLPLYTMGLGVAVCAASHANKSAHACAPTIWSVVRKHVPARTCTCVLCTEGGPAWGEHSAERCHNQGGT